MCNRTTLVAKRLFHILLKVIEQNMVGMEKEKGLHRSFMNPKKPFNADEPLITFHWELC